MSEVSASEASSSTVETFLTAFVTNSALLGIQLAAFVLLKHRLSRIYAPRTYLPPPEKRAVELPSGPWKWLPALVMSPTEDVMEKNGLDAYVFLRFLRLMIIIFASFTLVTWIILLPVDTVDIQGTERDGLSRLSWGNIPTDASKRYAAHTILIYLLTFWVLYLIRHELFHFIRMRQTFLTSKSHAHLPQARTVLITSIPKDMCSEKELRRWASFVPGGIENIWVYRDTRDLTKIFEERLDACKKLEAAEMTVLRHALKAQHKRRHKHGKKFASDKADTTKEAAIQSSATPIAQQHQEVPYHPTERSPTLPTGTSNPDLEGGKQTASEVSPARALLDELVPLAKRPKHRLGLLGLWGRKVDTIEHYKSEIVRLTTAIDALRLGIKDAEPLGSAFIECNLQMGAHVLAQCVSYHEPLMMTQKWVEVTPKDVIWSNIDDGAYESRARYVISWIANIGLIVLWFVPVSFVGMLSNVSDLCIRVKWLAWICSARGPVQGIVQGVLPPLFLAILFAILPLILQALAWYANIPRHSLVSLSVYKRYYIFLVIHGFLVVTLSSGITATITHIVSAPTKTISELASHLPDASVFFLTWTVTQGLTGAGSAILQVAALVLYFVKQVFLGRTPRQTYAVTFLMPSADFGTVLPRMSLLATVALVYSILSPIINGLATLAFVLIYFAWKFLLIWVFDQPDDRETGGLYFPQAIQNIFVGLYIEQICLAALFFLKISSGIEFLAQGILMIVLIGITILAQLFFQKSFDPLARYLPMSIATKKMQARYEHQRHKQEHGEEDGDEMDLFSRNIINSVIRKRITKVTQALEKEISMSPKQEQYLTEGASSSFLPHIPPPSGLQQTLSHTSSHSSHSSKHRPEHPVFAPAAPSPDSDDDDQEFDDHGFDPPSTYADQPWIWLPRDELGLSSVLVEELTASGVSASDQGALINSKGVVEVRRSPPDEAWEGGHDA